jgi:hypothetical protein
MNKTNGSALLATFTGDGGASGPTAGPACMAFQAACPGVSVRSMMTQF